MSVLERLCHMGKVETEILTYIKRRLDDGALSVPESEVIEAVIPPDHPEFRLRPAYKYGLKRLLRRHEINAVPDRNGMNHYYIGNFPSTELLKSLDS
jgi:hypothetical protein